MPSRYWGSPSYGNSGSAGLDVQAALARRGYYHGTIDGAIGPMSRSARSNWSTWVVFRDTSPPVYANSFVTGFAFTSSRGWLR